MNVNLKFLLLGTSLPLIPTLSQAQCVATTDCATLGYTETTNKGSCLKCPFGNAFACPISETKFCDKYEFEHNCKGTGYIGGIGKSCNEKYTGCQCAAEYVWKNGKCEINKGPEKAILGQCNGYAKNCQIGYILYSDGTCSLDRTEDKNPLGVIIAIKENCGYAMTASAIAKNIKWTKSYENIPSLPKYDTWREASRDYDACNNTQKIINTGNASDFPAAWAAYEYTPNGAENTKGKWCLPSAGMLSSLYLNIDTINGAIWKLGGNQLSNYKQEQIWSSSEYNYSYAWKFCFIDGAESGGISRDCLNYTDSTEVVRPVLPF